ncbi:phage late control protein GPD [compost metagenome]
MSLQLSDRPGMASDSFELRIDDRFGAVSLPIRGVSIEVYLGYAGADLTRMGRYTMDEVAVSCPPDTLVISGKASDMRGSGSGKTTRSGSWEDVSLALIVGDVAARNGWQPSSPVDTRVPRMDQLNESDFNFITRVAKNMTAPPMSPTASCWWCRDRAGRAPVARPWHSSPCSAAMSPAGSFV